MGEENYHLVLGKENKCVYLLGPSGRIVICSIRGGESSLEEKIDFLIFRYTKDNTITRNLTEIPVDTKVPEECKGYYDPLPGGALDYFISKAKPQKKYKSGPILILGRTKTTPLCLDETKIYPPLSHSMRRKSFRANGPLRL